MSGLVAKLGHEPNPYEFYDNLVAPADAVLHNSGITVNNEGNLEKDGWAYREVGQRAVVLQTKLLALQQPSVSEKSEPKDSDPFSNMSLILEASYQQLSTNMNVMLNNLKLIFDMLQNDGIADAVSRAKLVRGLNRLNNATKQVNKLMAGLQIHEIVISKSPSTYAND